VIAYISSFNLQAQLPGRLSISKNYTVPPRIKRCTVIIHEPLGRLGNVLFEFAAAYGLALDQPCHLYIGPGFIRDLSRYFEINLPNILTKSQLNGTLPNKKIYNHCTYFPNLFDSNTSQIIELLGYWQVQKYFVNHTDEIRKQLQFKPAILNKTKTFIKTTVSSTMSNLVGIHIRRGDFIGQRTVSSEKFIFDAMDYFTRKYRSIGFIFVSDDKAYCRRIYGKRNDTFVTPDSFNPAEDMAVISLCNHAIITVGTYGWWGAFLLHNKSGEVITDSKPNHSPLDVDCEASAFFPPWFSFLNKTK